MRSKLSLENAEKTLDEEFEKAARVKAETGRLTKKLPEETEKQLLVQNHIGYLQGKQEKCHRDPKLGFSNCEQLSKNQLPIQTRHKPNFHKD